MCVCVCAGSVSDLIDAAQAAGGGVLQAPSCEVPPSDAAPRDHCSDEGVPPQAGEDPLLAVPVGSAPSGEGRL